ncbi:hypothetical protein CLOP_g19721 [Closterium sp. NIES-67]|nr:hypothetical protein CLOP_g19721 [Closterium sp. NIES-67]
MEPGTATGSNAHPTLTRRCSADASLNASNVGGGSSAFSMKGRRWDAHGLGSALLITALPSLQLCGSRSSFTSRGEETRGRQRETLRASAAAAAAVSNAPTLRRSPDAPLACEEDGGMTHGLGSALLISGPALAAAPWQQQQQRYLPSRQLCGSRSSFTSRGEETRGRQRWCSQWREREVNTSLATG